MWEYEVVIVAEQAAALALLSESAAVKACPSAALSGCWKICVFNGLLDGHGFCFEAGLQLFHSG